MTPRLIALCIAGSTATTVGAQATVSLSGIVDMAARSVSHEGGGSMKSLVSGSNSTSRIILNGSEDLGNGLRASFHLEHGLLGDTGTTASSAKFWDRRSTVSLSSRPLGELRLGRDFVPSYVNWSRYDPFAYVGVARSANLVSAAGLGPIRSAFGTSANTTVRSDNGVQYLLPGGLGGIEGGLMVAPGEGGAVASGLAKLVGLRLGYASGSFGVSAATTVSENTQTTAGKFKDSAVGAAATVGAFRLSTAWRKFDYDAAQQVLWMVGAVGTFGPHEVKASWVKANLSGRVGASLIDANDTRQLGVGYVYNLSKRTALYATAAQISNEGAARFLISDGPATLIAGGTSRGYEAGIRHRF